MAKFVDSEGLNGLVQKLKDIITGGKWLHIENGKGQWAIQTHNATALGNNSFAEGGLTKAIGEGSHVEGWETQAIGTYSHAEGFLTKAGTHAHAEGEGSNAKGIVSHAEGYNTVSQGYGSHSEGKKTIAYSTASHAEGRETEAGSENDTDETGGTQHAEGYKTKAVAVRSHAEGSETQALGYASHAEGLRTIARGYRAHTEGQDTCILSTGGHAQGMANYHTNDLNVIHDIGIGTVVDSTDTDGTPTVTRLSAEATLHTEDVRNGYKYLIGVGGYKGQEIGNASSVQEVIASLADKIHTKVTKKKPYGQVVIGRSINPMSYGWGTWYAFMGNPCITVWSDNETETFNVYVNDVSVGTISSKCVEKDNKVRAEYSHLLHFRGAAGFYQLAEEYAKGDKDIYLKYVEYNPNYKSRNLPINLTGTSKTYSWNNGKRVTNKRGTFEDACECIRKVTIGEQFFKSANRVEVYKMCSTSKSMVFRENNLNRKRRHTKFTRLHPKDRMPIAKGRIGGLWLVRFWDRLHVRMNDVRVYVRVGAFGNIFYRRA